MIRPLNVLVTVILCCTGFSAIAQVAEPLYFPKNTKRAACNASMNAGSIASLTNLRTGEIQTSDPIILCFGDQLFIDHEGNGVLTGDPDPGSTPGIGYLFYDGDLTCDPTVTGETTAEIRMDPCLLMPGSGADAYIARGNYSGDATFVNNGTIQDQFFNGGSGALTFAPATIPDFDATPPDFDDGECLHVSVDQAFTIVYLNQIVLDNFMTPPNSLSGTLTLNGGLPEWDNNSRYTVSIVKEDDPTVTGTVDVANLQGAPASSTFSVPEAGSYIITVTDEQGCSQTFSVYIPHSDPVNVCFGNASVEAGSTVCVPITVTDFTALTATGFAVGWDPRLFEFVSYQNLNPIFSDGVIAEDFVDNGLLKLIFFFSFDGESLPDNDTLFELCLTAIGPPGSTSGFGFAGTEEGGVATEFAGLDDLVPFIAKDGILTITVPTVPVITYEACPDGSGSVDLVLTVFGGNGPYNVDVVDQGGSVVHMFSLPSSSVPSLSANLAAGTYDLLLVDASGNMSSRNITLVSDEIMIDATGTSPSCGDARNGKIVINSITGGAGEDILDNYDIVWEGPNFIRFNDDSIPQLGAGQYVITATDENGCSASDTINLMDSPISGTFNITPTLCPDDNDGQIEYVVSGSSSNQFEFEWANEQGQLVRTAQNIDGSDTYEPVSPGKYFVTVTDGVCEIVDSVVLGSQKRIDLIVQEMEVPQCAGDAAGLIQVAAIVGNRTGTTITWSSGAGNPTMINDSTIRVTNIPPGTYDLTVEDGGCSLDTTFVIPDPTPVVAYQQDAIRNPTCDDGMNGRIELGFSNVGGTPFTTGPRPYYMRWYNLTDGQNTLITDRSNSLINQGPGTYGVYVEDANGCSDSAVYELTLGPTVLIEIEMENVCKGDSMASLIVRGDVESPNTILWSTGETTQTITGLKEGIYWVEITETADGASCVIRDSFELIDPGVDVQVTSPMQFVVRNQCNEPDSGLIFNHLLNYPGPKDYIWPTLNDTVTPGFINVFESGTYPFMVVDSRTGCVLYDSAVVAQFPEKIDVTVDTTHVSCFGDQDGGILVSASGRSGQFNFEWDNGVSSMNTTSTMAQSLPAGTYLVTVTESTDANCVVPLEITINEPDALTLTLDSTLTQQIRCFGDVNGAIGVNWEGGNMDAAPTITWSDPTLGSTLFAENLSAGTYTITLEDSRGCTDMLTYDLIEPQQLRGTVPMVEEPLCNGYQTTITVENVSGGTGPNYMFSVDNGPTQQVGESLFVFAGDRTVTIFDEKGCRIDTSLTIGEPAPLTVDLGSDLSVVLGDSVDLNPTINGPNPIVSYTWTPNEILSCDGCADPTATPIQDQEVLLVVIDETGCEGRDMIFLNVDKARLVYIPNAFTPNGDGLNDSWQVFTGPGVRGVSGYKIFDRWGNVVYEAGEEDYDRGQKRTVGWNGEGRTEGMNPAVFAYLVEVEFIDGRIILYRGDVTLLR